MVKGPQRKAMDKTLRALRDSLEDEHAALIAALQGLADAVDAEPTNAALWRELRAALNDLREVAAGGIDDEAADFLRRVSVQSAMGNQAHS